MSVPTAEKTLPLKPHALPVAPENIPDELKDRAQWVAWQHQYNHERDEWSKVPINPKAAINGPGRVRNASSTDARTWGTFDQALEACQMHPPMTEDVPAPDDPNSTGNSGLDGIGINLKPDDGIVGVDLDHCLEDGRVVDPDAIHALELLAGTYVEVSPSGTGLRLFCRGRKPGTRSKSGDREMYDGRDAKGNPGGRFLTLTGHTYGEPCGITEKQEAINALYARWFTEETKAKPNASTNGTTKNTQQNSSADDEILLERMFASRHGADIKRLYDGDTSAYAKDGNDGESEADLALINHLLWWCDYNTARADQLFRGSALYRPKWDQMRGERTYGENTIGTALRGKAPGDGYRPGPSVTFKQSRDEEAGENPPDLLEFFRTDYGNAERLHALFGHRFRYCAALGYLVWDETRWKVDEGSELTRMALSTARALFAQAGNEANSERREAWVKHSLACERKAAIENAVSLAKSIPGVSVNVDELDADPMLLNVKNGTIDLRTGKLKAHDPRDLITKLAPVTFDPATKSPLWDQFQNTICGGDADLVAFKQRAYGYTATGKTSEDALFIPFGNGANGKSTEQNIILRILGDYANTAQFETFAVKKNESVRNDIADLVGSRFVSASEGESRQRLAEGLVKQMTGGDPMKARFLHREYFTFQPAFKLWLATNHKPVIRGTDHGIWRRIRLVPYAVTIPPERRDRRLREKLEGELSGILNWVLKGCADWLEHGLGEAEAVSAATESYRQESDVLSSFLSEKCITDELHRVLAKPLYQAYKKFSEDNGDDSFSSTMFGRLLNERGYMAEKRGGKVYRLGLSLQEETGGQDS